MDPWYEYQTAFIDGRVWLFQHHPYTYIIINRWVF